METNIQDIYVDILKDPDLYDSIVREYHEKNPSASKEQIHVYILKLIAAQLAKEADQEKKQRQLDIVRDRIASKALDNLPDSNLSTTNKAKIKSSFSRVSNSGTGHDREEVADLLKDFSDTQAKRIKRRGEANDDIERRK